MAAEKTSDSKSATSMELEGDRTIVIARTFRAPPRIVFDVWTNAEPNAAVVPPSAAAPSEPRSRPRRERPRYSSQQSGVVT